MFNFNDKVVNVNNGFMGIVTGIANYKCLETQYQVEAIDTTGRPVSCWYVEKELEKVED